MCQLYVDDIRQEDGVWVLDINKNAPDKNLKTESSERLIPLHPFLIDELRFDVFVEKMRNQGEMRLFPELKRKPKGGYGRAMTRWFPLFREKAGVPQFDGKGHKRVFHSFRHTFDTRLKHKYVKSTMIDELMGHAVEKLSMGTYGALYPLQQKLEDGIMKLDFDLTVFESLKKCRYFKGL